MKRLMEELAMNAWPSLRTQHYDGWVLRYANGYTRRANSVYPLYPGTLDVKTKLAYCEEVYSSYGLSTTFKLYDDETMHNLDIFLEDNGYHVLHPTDVMMMCLDDFKSEMIPEYRTVHGYSTEAAHELSRFIGTEDDSKQSADVRETMGQMMKNITPPSFYVFIEKDKQIIGYGNGVVEHGYLGVFNVGIVPDYRGKGFGRELMNAIILEGMKLGAQKTYLQVICKNEAAIRLYESMGYEKAYRYWYRRQG